MKRLLLIALLVAGCGGTPVVSSTLGPTGQAPTPWAMFMAHFGEDHAKASNDLADIADEAKAGDRGALTEDLDENAADMREQLYLLDHSPAITDCHKAAFDAYRTSLADAEALFASAEKKLPPLAQLAADATKLEAQARTAADAALQATC